MPATRKKPARTPPPPAPGARETSRVVLEGRVVEVQADDRAIFTSADGRTLSCRCPRHVDVAWLRAAVAIGPVLAEASAVPGSAEGSLWSVFPGPEHAGAVAATVEVRATEEVRLICGAAALSLKRDGRLRASGRDVKVRGSRSTRIRGGALKLN